MNQLKARRPTEKPGSRFCAHQERPEYELSTVKRAKTLNGYWPVKRTWRNVQSPANRSKAQDCLGICAYCVRNQRFVSMYLWSELSFAPVPLNPRLRSNRVVRRGGLRCLRSRNDIQGLLSQDSQLMRLHLPSPLIGDLSMLICKTQGRAASSRHEKGLLNLPHREELPMIGQLDTGYIQSIMSLPWRYHQLRSLEAGLRCSFCSAIALLAETRPDDVESCLPGSRHVSACFEWTVSQFRAPNCCMYLMKGSLIPVECSC